MDYVDPNEALTRLRRAIERIGDYRGGGFPRPDPDEAMDDAYEAFADLDGWLSRGGPGPDAWRVKLGDMDPK